MSDEWGRNAMAEAAALALRRAQAAERRVTELEATRDAILDCAQEAAARMLRAEQRAERLEGLLRELEGTGTGPLVYDRGARSWRCTICRGWQHWERQGDPFPHDPDCPVLLARAALEGEK